MVQPTKNIKVDESVHRELERLKRETGAQTFNDVLRKELGIIPGPKIDKLAAYLPQELRQAVKEIYEIIDQTGDFEKTVTEENQKNHLIFSQKNEGNEIAEIAFSEEWFKVFYKDQSGMMSLCGVGKKTKQDIEYHTDKEKNVTLEKLRKNIKTKIQGSKRRWR
ncbi:DNA binding protein containing RHH/copG family domain [Methanonatronarchaeum thermophilum]|uniref:DNA binding protein containing RHH/copG family domain n=1 Tax=Methanonatronarchaeum thermophilum TaxID=1927129 RepID=A0A1Y3GFY4_9EURY|nr:hypothetical protein [Methanonatronarchaeum thermophilum]OUJ19114.1 DNA binding protein containing RHH/copG family domain [Methanonatronarchaeum thermophilum]